MDLSLDEIIKSKRIGGVSASVKFPIKKAPLKYTGSGIISKRNKTMLRTVADARIKIIQKNRAKIRDARDKLVEITRSNGDARQRIAARKDIIMAKGLSTASFRNGRFSGGVREKMHLRRSPGYNHPTVQHQRMQNLIEIPRGYVDYDNMDRMEEEEYVSGHISRTVQNDIAHYNGGSVPPAPRRLDSWGTDLFSADPFEVYEVPHSRSDRANLLKGSESHNLRRHISQNISPDVMPPKGIHRSNLRSHSPPPSTESYSRRYIPEHSSHLSYEMRSRLQQAPNPHASMGIFANPLTKKQTPVSSNSGYRIVVSNLHNSVTQSDIKELFEDIGELYDSRIVRPGVAEVIYKNLKDADKAVDTYHNRQLDGQPMKCLLVNPRSSGKPTAPAIKPSSAPSSNARLTSGKTPLEIDIDALHKVLFRRH